MSVPLKGSTFAREFNENHKTYPKPYFQHNVVLVFGSSDSSDARNVLQFIKSLSLKYKVILRHSSQRTEKEIKSFKLQWIKRLNLPKNITFDKKIDHYNKIGEIDRIEVVVLNKKGVFNAEFYFLVAHTIALLVASEEI